MKTQGSSARGMLIASAPETLLAIAFLFFIPLWMVYCFDITSQGLESHFLRQVLAGSTIGVIVPSLAYLGLLFVRPIQKQVVEGFRPIVLGVCLTLSALMGGLLWFYLMVDDFEGGIYFSLSPLIFVIVPALAIYSRRWRASDTASLPGKGFFGLSGVALFLTYFISLSIYISVISIGGMLLSSPDRDFVQYLGINIVFWFLLPVHSAALLVYTIACRKYVRSQRAVAVRMALCTAIVLLAYSAVILVYAQVYGT